MNVDEKVKEYLDRAIQLLEENEARKGTTCGFTFRYENSCVIDIASLLQLEDHKQVSKKKRQRNDKDVYFDYEKNEWINLDSDFIKNMVNLHKDKDIPKEFEKMTSWLMSRSHKKNFKRFIVNWLNKDKRY
jgi:hypothetical protein